MAVLAISVGTEQCDFSLCPDANFGCFYDQFAKQPTHARTAQVSLPT